MSMRETTGSENVDYTDYIEYKPKNIVVLSRDKIKNMKKHYSILKLLEERSSDGSILHSKLLHLTASEIHERHVLNVKEENKKNKENVKPKSLKTIYRYIDNLVKDGFLVISGKRIKQNSRMIENLYCWVSELMFFEDDDPIDGKSEDEVKRSEKEKIKRINNEADHLNTLITSHLGIENFPSELIHEFYKDYFLQKAKIVDEIVYSADENEDVMNVYREMSDGMSINKINNTAAMLTLLLSKPELFDKIREHYVKNM